MLRKPFFLVVSICFISLFVMSPFANGFWDTYVFTTHTVYDIHDGKFGRTASDTSRTITPAEGGNGSYLIIENVAVNFFDEDGNYIETVYWENERDLYTFRGNQLTHIYEPPTRRTDTLRSYDYLY